MRKHNQIHTLGAPHFKAHFRFLRKVKDFTCAVWSKKYQRRIQGAPKGSRVPHQKGPPTMFMCLAICATWACHLVIFSKESIFVEWTLY